MQTTPAHLYEFGDFRLDTGKRLLQRLDGTTVPLPPRVFETLLFMLENHDNVLDKERLMEAVWPDSIVEENNLSQNISMLRRIFGETPNSHRYIVTVPGRGYRFVAEVSEPTDNGSAILTAEQTTKTTPAKEAGKKTGAPLAFAVLGIIVLVAAFLARAPILAWFGKHRIDNAASATSPATISETIHSIAVLPFAPLGSEMNNELLGLGMADAVIGRMSRLKELAVLPTNSVIKYSERTFDPVATGRALGVDAVLSGTVQRSDDHLRVSVQLINISSGRTVWSEKFDQTFTDIFGIQDSISDGVARSLASSLSTDERKQLGKHYTASTAAYDSYLMGLHFWSEASKKEAVAKAISYFEKAVQQDPNFALAYALMADCYHLQVYYGYASASDTFGKVKAAADQALLLDDSLAEAHVAKAMVQCLQKEVGPSTKSLRRASELNPNLAVAHLRYAWCLFALGQLDDAVREMKRAQELDPLSPTNNTALGTMLAYARQFRGSLEYCSRAAELDPNQAAIQENLAIAYSLNGMYQQAIDQYRTAGELGLRSNGDVLASIATVLISAGRNSEADSMMPEILQLAVADKADSYNVAVLCAARGDKENGFKWLERAVVNHHLMSGILRYDPLLDPLRSDNRFAALIRQHDHASLLDKP